MTIPSLSPKTLIGLSVFLLIAAAVFAVLNSLKVSTLREEAATAVAARDSAEQRRLVQERQSKAREQSVTGAPGKNADAESRTASAEAELVKMHSERADLQAKLAANEKEILSLRQQVVDAAVNPGEANPAAASAVELQAQLDDVRRQLESAEREKELLAEKLRSNADRTTQVREPPPRREVSANRAGIRGTVLAVNQAYNFVVLNLGGRNGVEANSEMLVVRGTTVIGKIRISSVEPATAIGDIITSSLARGVQVQPGDIVIYGGSNS